MCPLGGECVARSRCSDRRIIQHYGLAYLIHIISWHYICDTYVNRHIRYRLILSFDITSDKYQGPVDP